MSALLSLHQAAPLLGCRDTWTARKRLAALGVSVLELDGRVYVEEVEPPRTQGPRPAAHGCGARERLEAFLEAPSGPECPKGTRARRTTLLIAEFR